MLLLKQQLNFCHFLLTSTQSKQYGRQETELSSQAGQTTQALSSTQTLNSPIANKVNRLTVSQEV